MEMLRWFFMMLLGLFLAWAFFGSRGGMGGPFIKPPPPLSDSSVYGDSTFIKNSDLPADQTGDFQEIGEDDPDSGFIDIRNLDKELEKIEGFSDSPYKDLVTIKSVSGAKRSDPDNEIIELRVSRDAKEKIPITNWRLESAVSNTGDKIDKGAYLPYSGRVNTESHIFVNAGDRILISTGRSPLGTSFRINQCTGYFEQFQDFTPSLRKECPKPIDDLPNVGVGDTAERCVDFVERLPRCEIFLESVPENIGGTCQEYVTRKVNYNTCVENHKDGPEFYKGEWRIYLGRNDELWRQKREIIKLVDQNGLVVDAVSY